jgi:CheY-like chemotaxis protein
MYVYEDVSVAMAVKVLLVDDSKFLRIANERSLVKAGYQVSTAADGEEALRVAQDKMPDIILLDMLLPKISGPEVLRALKQNPATMSIPVVVLTSLSQKNEEKLLHEGAAAYFEKSTLELDKSSDLLAATVETVLRKITHQKELDRRLQEAALKRAAAQASTTEVWEVELKEPEPKKSEPKSEPKEIEAQEIQMKAVESSLCTTTAPRPRLKK